MDDAKKSMENEAATAEAAARGGLPARAAPPSSRRGRKNRTSGPSQIEEVRNRPYRPRQAPRVCIGGGGHSRSIELQKRGQSKRFTYRTDHDLGPLDPVSAVMRYYTRALQ